MTDNREYNQIDAFKRGRRLLMELLEIDGFKMLTKKGEIERYLIETEDLR